MNRTLPTLALLLAAATAPAQVADHLIEAELARTQGILSKTPVYQRALLALPPHRPPLAALLYFRGKPGIVGIEPGTTRHPHLGPLRTQQAQFFAAGIALVVVDCPTDQLAPTHRHSDGCDDEYRESRQHADDVRTVLAHLRDKVGITRFYVMGHSKGTMSSRWLAVHLGDEIAGSIHSASINASSRVVTRGDRAAQAIPRIRTPMLHVHHEQDACFVTPYSLVAAYARDNLVTVQGGTPAGDPCGGTHLHSHAGREAGVARAIVAWITSGTVTPRVGEGLSPANP